MSTELGEKLQEAMNGINTLVWIDKDGVEVKMMDAPRERVIDWYRHAHSMLYNGGLKNPGEIFAVH